MNSILLLKINGVYKGFIDNYSDFSLLFFTCFGEL